MNNPFRRVSFGQTPDPSAYGTTSPAASSPDAPDERVRRGLEATSTPYQVTPGHNFGVTLRYSEDARTQLVFIGSDTQTLLRGEWRRVWSWSFAGPSPLPWDKALSLLDEKHRRAVGSWFVSVEGSQTSVGYHMMVPADASPEELEDALQAVGAIADEMEKATVGTDAF